MLERIPYIFTHNSFRPDQPVIYESPDDTGATGDFTLLDRQRMLIWKLLQFSPLMHFSKVTHKNVVAMWHKREGADATAEQLRIFPSSAIVKWTNYDGYIRNTRANYSFYVPQGDKGVHAYLMVPALHTPAEAPVPTNDVDMRNMSPEAFDWCRNHGTGFQDLMVALNAAYQANRIYLWTDMDPEGGACEPPADGILIMNNDRMAVYTEGPGWTIFLAWVVETEIKCAVNSSERNAYMHMLAYQLLTGREEDGVATAALSFTLDQLHSSWEEMTINAQRDTAALAVDDPAFEAERVAALEIWDRCSPMLFPSHKLEHSLHRDRLWYFHFPESHVRLRLPDNTSSVPWITQFHQKDKLTTTLRRLQQVITLFDADVVQEIAAAVTSEGAIPLTDLQRQQLRSLCVFFATPGTALHSALSCVGTFSIINAEADMAAEQSKAAILAAPVAFRTVMEEARRLLHFDLVTCNGTITPETQRAAQQRIVMAIGDPRQAWDCVTAVYEPYRQLHLACMQKMARVQEEEAYARALLMPAH